MSDEPLTKDQIENIRVEASDPDVQEGLVSMIPNEVRVLAAGAEVGGVVTIVGGSAPEGVTVDLTQ